MKLHLNAKVIKATPIFRCLFNAIDGREEPIYSISHHMLKAQEILKRTPGIDYPLTIKSY